MVPVASPAPEAVLPVLGHVRALAALGPRLTGSAAENITAAYTAAVLGSAGMTVRLERMPWPDWHDAGSRIEAGGHVMAAVTGTFSPPGDVVGQLRVVRRPEDLTSYDAAGRVVVVDRGPDAGPLATARALGSGVIPSLERDRAWVTALRVSGAAAVVLLGPPVAHRPLTADPDLPMPHVTISRSAAGPLLEAGRARVVVQAVRRRGHCLTVSARNRPATRSRRVVLLAHLDSAPGSTGVLDNSTGVAVALEAARTLALEQPWLPLEVTLADGTQFWGAGMLEHVAAAGALDGVLGCVNIDAVGCRDRETSVVAVGCGARETELVRGVLTRHTGATGWLQPPGNGWPGNHQAYSAHGVPSVVVTCHPRHDEHAPAVPDDETVLDADRLQATVALVVDLARALAARARW
jgi:Iap family predicted aminopeptidase